MTIDAKNDLEEPLREIALALASNSCQGNADRITETITATYPVLHQIWNAAKVDREHKAIMFAVRCAVATAASNVPDPATSVPAVIKVVNQIFRDFPEGKDPPKEFPVSQDAPQ